MIKLRELKKAVEIMTEEQLLSLWELYEQLDIGGEEDIGGYRARAEIVCQEIDKYERTKVDEKLARKIGYWMAL